MEDRDEIAGKPFDASLTQQLKASTHDRIEQIAEILGVSPSVFFEAPPTLSDESPPGREQIAAFTASPQGASLVLHIMAIPNAEIRQRLLHAIIQMSTSRANLR